MSKQDALKSLLNFVVQAIRAKGDHGLSSGELYTHLMPFGCTFSQYQNFLAALKESGFVKERGHLLTLGNTAAHSPS